MLTAMKALFSSRKFWLSTIIAPVVLSFLAVVLPLIGISPEMVTQIITWVGGIMGAGVAGQGLADFGKNAVQPPAPPK